MASSKQNFFAEHYDWLVACAGLLLLAGAASLYVASLGNSPEDARAECKRELEANKPARIGVAPANIKLLNKALEGISDPSLLKVPGEKEGSFLASEGRVFCQNPDMTNRCHRPIPAACEVCPFCGYAQPSKKPVDVTRIGGDADNDGLPDAWEGKYGFNPNDPADAQQDPDGDTFTNLEEFEAKTDPKDPQSHPNYLDFLSVVGDLRKETLPFWFKMANQIRNGYRLTFEVHDKKYRNAATALVGEEIVFQLARPKFEKGRMLDDKVKSGWRVVKYNKKEDRVLKKGSEQKTTVDVSTVDLERVSDKRALSARVGVKSVAIEEQVDLQWSRGGGKKLTVTTGSEFELVNRKYRVKKIAKGAKGCEVTIADLADNTEKKLQ